MPRRDLVLWIPVAVGAGIGGYFALPVEPPVAVGWLAVAATGLAAMLLWRAWGLSAALLLVLPAIGFAVAQGRAHAVAAPVLAEPTTALVEGQVIGLSQSASGLPRLLLGEVTVYGVPPADTPRYVRVTLRRAADAEKAPVGATISVMAALSPPGGPVSPGAFDFRRAAWFLQLGAVGTSRGALVALVDAPRPALSLAVTRLRAHVSTHLRRVIGGDAGAFAAAIVTGDRSGLPPMALEALRASGLAHLLAISGLHMAIAGGLVFTASRHAMVAIPGLAERWRPKRIAALVALMAALGYLILSGGSVATQRAFVMAAVALGGILLDRPAVSLRGLCLAATLILLAAPESLLAVGFQMSFAATLALVAAYGAAREGGWLKPSRTFGERFRRYALALLATSLIAGVATAPFAAWHFNRLSLFGLLGNLAAVPVMGFWVAPALAAGGLAELFGVGKPLLWLAGAGIDGILAVAAWVAALPGATRPVAAAPGFVLGLITLGGLWLCLVRGVPRLAGCGLIAVGLIAWPQSGDPSTVLLLAPEGRLAALRGPEGLVPDHPTRGRYYADQWLRRDGDAATPAEAAVRPGWLREAGWMLSDGTTGVNVAMTRAPRVHPGEMATHCRHDTILVAPRARVGQSAPCLVIDAATMEARSGIAARHGRDGLSVVSASTAVRLWSGPAQ
jgi:competence protein ComEC